VRVDSGVTEGDEVSLHYDSLLAKLIASGRNREEAIGRMAQALSEFRIAGIPTTLAFHRRVMSDPAFRTGGIDTGYVRRLLAQTEPELEAEAQAAALVAAAHLRTAAATRRSLAAAAAPDFRLRAGRGTGWERGFPRDPWRLG
jgi:3-methylcrotonyl-CoA carboxylase alpha subunit